MLDIKIIEISSFSEALSRVPAAIELFKTDGILVFRGYKFSTVEQLIISSKIGDFFGWNICTENIGITVDENTIENYIFNGGHSDNESRPVGKEDDYALDWHIEQVFYVEPILAGIWNMFKFTSPKTSGNTCFVDSSTLYSQLPDEEKKFLDHSIVKWDKPIGPKTGFGPFYTKAIDVNTVTGLKTIRLETDGGCIVPPTLYKYKNFTPSKTEKDRFNTIYLKIKDKLFSDESIRFTHMWEEGDMVIVDLFKMYHAVLDGFLPNSRKFTGIFARPKLYTSNLHTATGATT